MLKVVVSKARFDDEFQRTLDKLALKRFADGGDEAKFENSPVGAMHRAFHFEVCRLKGRLEAPPSTEGGG